VRLVLRHWLTVAVMAGVPVVSAVAVAPTSQAQIAPCVVTITPAPIYTDTTVNTTVTGFGNGETVNLVQTHNGTPSQGTQTASSTGTLSFPERYALGSWTDAWTGTQSGATCSVSWTVLEPPTTTVPPSSSTSTTVTSTPTTAQAAAAVHSSPAFTG